MTHFIETHLLIPTLLLFAATAQADEAACLAAPVQGCVFELARDAALGAEKPHDLVGGLLAIAAWQERAGSDRAAGTVRELLDIVEAREAEPAKQLQLLDRAGWGVDLVGSRMVAAQIAKAAGAIAVDDEARRAQVEIRYRVHTGELDKIGEMIRAADIGTQRDLALTACSALMEAGDFAAAFELGAIVGTDEFRAVLDQTAVISLLRQDNIEAAEVAAAMTAEPGMQAEAYVRVAEALASRGRQAEALGLLAVAEPLAPDSENAYFPAAFADVLARIGERDLALAWLAKSPIDKVPPRRLNEIRATAALVAGDVDGLLAIVAKAERPSEGGFWVKSAVAALLQSRQGEIEPVLVRLSPEQLPFALNALGLYQARAGDTDAALRTLARLRGLGEAGRVHGDFRAELARCLVHDGMLAKAVALATDGKDPRLIAEIAALLQN